MTRDEYLSQLKAYINEQMATVQSDGTRHSLSFWTKFNQEKEQEFKQLLANQGIVVE